MSTSYHYLIPEDPYYMPPSDTRTQAKELLASILQKEAWDTEVELIESDTIRFFDACANEGAFRCPSCGRDLFAWWADRMDEDYDREHETFKLGQYTTPCCHKSITLHEVDYEQTQGFGRFALKVKDIDYDFFDDKTKEMLEGVLGTRLRVVYQYI